MVQHWPRPWRTDAVLHRLGDLSSGMNSWKPLKLKDVSDSDKPPEKLKFGSSSLYRKFGIPWATQHWANCVCKPIFQNQPHSKSQSKSRPELKLQQFLVPQAFQVRNKMKWAYSGPPFFWIWGLVILCAGQEVKTSPMLGLHCGQEIDTAEPSSAASRAFILCSRQNQNTKTGKQSVKWIKTAQKMLCKWSNDHKPSTSPLHCLQKPSFWSNLQSGRQLSQLFLADSRQLLATSNWKHMKVIRKHHMH